MNIHSLFTQVTLLASETEQPLVVDASVAEIVNILTILLLVATGVALISRRYRVPYITGLVLAGLAITELLPQPVRLDPNLILNLLLPILVFQASINTDLSRLRSTLTPISLLAGPGLFIASAVTALILKFVLDMDWIPALLTGTILANTDTISVIAVFKEIKVPDRLATIVEGESLFNDGVSLVLFGLIIEAYTTGGFTLVGGIQQLSIVMIGGSLLGLAIGYLCNILLLALSDDFLSGILLTVAVAFGSFQAGQALQVSGVVVVVMAGLTIGNRGLSQSLSASSKITLINFWEYADFCVNTFVFLLIGLEVNLWEMWTVIPEILLAILAYQIGRIVSVYPLIALSSYIDLPIPTRWTHVLFLGNIKGSLSMVMALSLPVTVLGRTNLITLIYGSVLLSLVVQGLSLSWLIKKVNITPISKTQQQIELAQSKLISAKAAQAELLNMHNSGILSKSMYEEIRADYQVGVAEAENELRTLNSRASSTHRTNRGKISKLNGIKRQLLMVERNSLNDAVRKRIISADIVADRIRAIDDQLTKLEC